MSNDSRRAAVLVPLHRGDDDSWHLTLIERSPTLALHPGQVAFPGGSFDPSRDGDLFATALREAREEIGLTADAIDLLGVLPERATYTSAFRIVPFVARIDPRFPFTLAPQEVASLFTVPLARFLPSEPRDRWRWQHNGNTVHVPCVFVDGRPIWGATLDIIDDLLQSSLVDRAASSVPAKR